MLGKELAFRLGDLRTDLTTLVNSLDMVKLRDGENCDWNAIDILLAIASNTDTFFFVSDIYKDDCVVIRKTSEDTVWVWTFYSTGSQIARTKYMDDFFAVLGEMGVKHIEYASGRPGHERLMKRWNKPMTKKVVFKLTL